MPTETIGNLSRTELGRKLSREGLCFHVGPFIVRLTSDIAAIKTNLELLYGAYKLAPSEFADFHLELVKSKGFRRLWRPQVNFIFDGQVPFKPLPYSQSFAFFEWGLNWCVAAHAHQYLIIHAAVIEKNGRLLVMPGSPGAGKSTLTSALINRGWRLFSDEMALIDPVTLNIKPIPRPVSLKNESIEIIKHFAPSAQFGLFARDTHKGTVTHIKPGDEAVRTEDSGKCTHIIFPQFKLQSSLSLTPLSKGEAYMRLAEQSFNYNVHGASAFRALTQLVSEAATFTFTYSQLDDAVDCFERI